MRGCYNHAYIQQVLFKHGQALFLGKHEMCIDITGNQLVVNKVPSIGAIAVNWFVP